MIQAQSPHEFANEIRDQPTVTFAIGDHVNVLHIKKLDIKNSETSYLLILIEFSQSLVLLTIF